MEGFDLLNKLAEHGTDPDDPDDEFIDRQFDELYIHGIQSGVPYPMYEGKAA